MNEQWIKNLINGWRQKAHQEGDPFSKFVFIWFCFNAWIENLSDANSDRKMIDELKSRKSNMANFADIFHTALNSRENYFKSSVTALVHQSQEKPIENARDKNKAPVSIKDEFDFENIVEAIYRIRCNLFHGGKDPDDSRDQVLVKTAQRVLERWIDDLVKSWGM